MSQPTIKLLFITDSPEEARRADPALWNVGDIEVVPMASASDNVPTLIALHQPDVVVIDYDMPGIDPAQATRAILREDPTVQVLMISLVGNVDDIRHAMRAGARDYLIKPLNSGELVETVRWLIQERREYARMQAFVGQLRRAYEALFTDDKPVPPTVVALLEEQAAQNPTDHLALETLAVAYARNRDWQRLRPLVDKLTRPTTQL